MSTMMCPDLVVGEIGFGPNLDFDHDAQTKVCELIRSNNRLIRILKRCVKPSNEIASEAHDAIEEAMAIRE